MRKICTEYKEILKHFILCKPYMISILIIAALSYGFTITNFSIGVDDLQQDRYVTGTFLMSQGRWGNVLLARIFNTVSFTPFWTDFIAVILFIFLTMILCAFIKKEIGNIADKPIYYIIFSGILLSYPIISNVYIYHFANIITAVSNIAMILIAILIYENVFNLRNKKIYFAICFILPFFISMYEACCQTFLSFIFIVSFINLIKNKKVDKEIFAYIKECIVILITGTLLNYFINTLIIYILKTTGTLTQDFSSRTTIWFSTSLSNSFMYLKEYVYKQLIIDARKFGYIMQFFIISAIAIILSIIQSIKNKRVIYAFLSFCIIFANFSISFIQTRILYRTNSSWSITIAFLILYILICFKKYKVFSKILLTLSCFIILYNSRQLTLEFYNDYKRYDREKNIAYDIANTIMRICQQPNKPLVYIPYNSQDLQGNAINYDNGWSIIGWGLGAFNELGTETTKFINSLGYNFKIASNEEALEGYNEFTKISDKYKDDFIIELDKYIIVKVIKESR